MKSQSSGNSGTYGSQRSPNSLSYQVTSSYYYSNPTSHNTIESKELEHMLDYALESKRVVPKVSTTSKREQTEEWKRRQKQKEIEAQKQAQAGKGKGHRKKKNLKQLDMLEKVYRVKQKWTRDDLTKLASCTGLTRAQIYKWNWDMRKKDKLEDSDVPPHKVMQAFRSPPQPLPISPHKVLQLPVQAVPLPGRSKTPVRARVMKETQRLSVRRASALPSLTKVQNAPLPAGIPRFPSIASPPPLPLNFDGISSRHMTPTPMRLPTLNAKLKHGPNVTPYLQSAMLVTPPPRRPNSTMRSSKRKQRVQKLQSRLERIHFDSPIIDSGPTTVSHKTPEMTPHFNHSFEFGFGDVESALIFSSEKKRKKKPEQPPPSTPILEINEEVRQKVGTLLQQRTCSQAYLYDDDNLSVPEIIFEKSKLEEEDGDHLESFLNERQRSNSLGRLTSEQTKNYLDEFLLQNQSSPISKIGSQLLPHSEESKSKKDQESLGSSLKPLRTQFMPGGYFRFESTSSGNTFSRRQVKTHRTHGLVSINGRMSSDSSWKNVGGPGGLGGIGAGSAEIPRMVTVSSGSQQYEAPVPHFEAPLPHDLSAQARILESRRYLLQDKLK